MSKFAIMVQSYYSKGFWDLKRVEKAFELGKITEDEFLEITKEKGEL